MLARVRAMLAHLSRSEGPERRYALEEISDIEERMYKYPLWERRSLRQRMRGSRLSPDEQEYFNNNLPVTQPHGPFGL